MSFSDDFRSKMQAEGLQKEFVDGWVGLYEKLCAGDKGMIPESSIEPVVSLPELESLPEGDKGLLGKTVLLKLNGGLGTGMGLDKAKSLLPLKGGNTFLDLIAQQVLKLRGEGLPVKFMLMNSFSTDADTKEFFEKYPEIAKEWDSVAFQQNKSPKVDAETMKPIDWPQKPSCEWCPPGHGDIYAALVCSGKLDQLLEGGYEYAFVSNSDNLGATLDLRLLGRLASGGAPMLMEVCVRGEDDKKGGHLCEDKATGKLTLRESAQCPEEDEKAFQDIRKHLFFNTNNLWLNLKKLKEAMVGGVLPLPLIVNEKKVDPTSKEKPNPKVFQLETAMGAAIASLPGSEAVVVPFDRFAPVKTCNQLFGLRSDAYVLSDDFTPVLSPGSFKPVVKFDDNYKMVPDMEAACPGGVPSLKGCPKLTVKGKVLFMPGAIVQGETTIVNEGDERAVVGGYLTGEINATGCTEQNPAGSHRITVPTELFQRIMNGEAVPEDEIKKHAPVVDTAGEGSPGKKKKKSTKVKKGMKGCC
jgi:UDP-N-acetylglucosamine pyrophosphorylase